MTIERDTLGKTYDRGNDQLEAIKRRIEGDFNAPSEADIRAATLPEAIAVNWDEDGARVRLKVQTQEDRERSRLENFIMAPEMRSSYVYVKLDDYLMRLADLAGKAFHNGHDLSLKALLDMESGGAVTLIIPGDLFTLSSVRQACRDLLIADADSSPEEDEQVFKTILKGIGREGRQRFDQRLRQAVKHDFQESLRTRLHLFAYNNRIIPNRPDFDAIAENRVRKMGKPKLSAFVEEYVDSIQESHRSVEDLVNLLIFSSLGVAPEDIDKDRREAKLTLDAGEVTPGKRLDRPTLTIDYPENHTFVTRLTQFARDDRDIYIDGLFAEELRIRGKEGAKQIRLAARADYTLSKLREAVRNFREGNHLFKHSASSNTVTFGGGYVNNLTFEVPYGVKGQHTKVDIVSGQLNRINISDIQGGHIHLAEVSGVVNIENCTGEVHILAGEGNVSITSADYVRISSREARVVHAGKAGNLEIVKSNIGKLTVYECAGKIEGSTLAEEAEIIDSPDFDYASLDADSKAKVEVII